MNQVASTGIQLFWDNICRYFIFFCFHLLLPFHISLFSSLEKSFGGLFILFNWFWWFVFRSQFFLSVLVAWRANSYFTQLIRSFLFFLHKESQHEDWGGLDNERCASHGKDIVAPRYIGKCSNWGQKCSLSDM